MGQLDSHHRVIMEGRLAASATRLDARERKRAGLVPLGNGAGELRVPSTFSADSDGCQFLPRILVEETEPSTAPVLHLGDEPCCSVGQLQRLPCLCNYDFAANRCRAG